jgi:hypothetical protein
MFVLHLNGSLFLSFAEAVTKPIGRYNEKDLPVGAAMSIDPIIGVLFFEAVGPQFREGDFGVIDFEETAFLRRIASVFGQSDLNAVTREYRRLMRRVLSRHYSKIEEFFIEGNRLIDVLNREVQGVIGVWPGV